METIARVHKCVREYIQAGRMAHNHEFTDMQVQMVGHISRAHSFPRAAEFALCRGMLTFQRNFAEFDK